MIWAWLRSGAVGPPSEVAASLGARLAASRPLGAAGPQAAASAALRSPPEAQQAFPELELPGPPVSALEEKPRPSFLPELEELLEPSAQRP